jgi:hypothetical protein
MRLSVQNVENLRDLAQEVIDAAEPWLEMQVDRASYEPDEIADAREELSTAIYSLCGLVLNKPDYKLLAVEIV